MLEGLEKDAREVRKELRAGPQPMPPWVGVPRDILAEDIHERAIVPNAGSFTFLISPLFLLSHPAPSGEVAH